MNGVPPKSLSGLIITSFLQGLSRADGYLLSKVSTEGFRYAGLVLLMTDNQILGLIALVVLASKNTALRKDYHHIFMFRFQLKSEDEIFLEYVHMFLQKYITV